MKFRTILLSNAGMIFIGSKVARYAKGKVFFRITADYLSREIQV